ncbi:hypothetical protein BJ912DRAFT_622850 [Pholiota molesta]|nr:hypothetical protein BJ912DRAFT_622850 [Pholiota molesta]
MLSLQRLRSRLYRPFRQLYRYPAPALNSWCSSPSAHSVPMSPLGTRMLATSKGTPAVRRPYVSPVYKLRTLCPERLEAVGQEAIDLSGKVEPYVRTLIDGPQLRCVYECEYPGGRRIRTPFPEGTKGVFYYYSPAEGPELDAGVRFRICESAAEFKRGRDLLGTHGDVWGPKVLELVKHKEHEAFLALSRAEQLISEALIADIDKLDISRRVGLYQVHLSDPFYLDLGQRKCHITYVTRAKVVQLVFPRKAFAVGTGGNLFPLTGIIKVQFELSNLREHKKLGPTLVIRVLDVINPIAVLPGYDTVPLPPMPVPGTLLHRLFHGRLRVVAIPLQRQRMAEDLLALAKTTWAQ